MKRILLALPALLLFISLFSLSSPAAGASTPFDPNRLIDDFVFENNSTMSASSIDSYLNSNFGTTSCINSTANANGNPGFRTADPQGWSSSQNKYLFGGNVTAGQAIYSAAQLYHINPQVILTTMQKEQGAVTGASGCHYTTPDSSAPLANPDTPTAGKTFHCSIGGSTVLCTYACTFSGGCMPIVMGYGCPGYCSVNDEGTSMQLTLGTWLLRFGQERAYGTLTGYAGYEAGDEGFHYSGPVTAGYRKLWSTDTLHYYDGTYTTQDGTSVTVTNGATASLYNFTPFISGNRSFDNTFQGAISDGYLGFGVVYAHDTLTPHPDGTLINYSGKVYLIENGKRRWITNGYVFDSYHYSWGSVKKATSGDASLPTGTNISTLAPGTIFYSGSSPIYVMTYDASGNQVKQQISLAAFNSLGYKWDRVISVPSWVVPSGNASGILFANQHPPGTVVADKASGKVFLIDVDATSHQPVKRWVFGPYAFSTNFFNWDNVKTATSADTALTESSRVNIRQGTMVYSSGNIYLIDDDASGILKRPVGPWECYADRWHYVLFDAYSVPSSALPNRTGSIATC